MFGSHPDSKEEEKKQEATCFTQLKFHPLHVLFFPPVTVATTDRLGFMCLGLKISASETTTILIWR